MSQKKVNPFKFKLAITYCSNACDVTLSVYPHRVSLKNMPDHGGNLTYDLWNTSPMLCQLSYAVWSVRVCDISEQNLVPSISMLSNNNHDFCICEADIYAIANVPLMLLLPYVNT